MDREWTKWTAEEIRISFGRPLRPLGRLSFLSFKGKGNKKMCRTARSSHRTPKNGPAPEQPALLVTSSRNQFTKKLLF